MDIEREIIDRLDALEIKPLLGGLIPEKATAELLGYSENAFRRLARTGASPLPFIKRGNRRLYKVNDIAAFVTNTSHK